MAYRFAKVRVVVGEPDRETRRILKATLADHGFRRVFLTDKMAELVETIRGGSVDLLICNANLGDDDFLAVTQDLRHERLGANPLVQVITLLPVTTRRAIVKAIESGADDVLAKPFSPRQIIDRIESLTRHRKPFVVTSDYVGPDRLKSDQPGRQIPPKIAVMNLLLAEAADGRGHDDLNTGIAEAAKSINVRKVERLAYQVGYLVDHLAPLLASLNGLDDAGPVLDRLAKVCSDIVPRLSDTPHGAIDRAARTMAVMAVKLKDAPAEAQVKWLHEMPTLAAEIRKIAPPLPVMDGTKQAATPSRWAAGVIDAMGAAGASAP